MIAIDAIRIVRGLAIIWNPSKVSLSNFVAMSHILSVEFHVIGSNVKGIISNVYGPYLDYQKLGFLGELERMGAWVGQSHWILGAILT